MTMTRAESIKASLGILGQHLERRDFQRAEITPDLIAVYGVGPRTFTHTDTGETSTAYWDEINDLTKFEA